MNTWIDFVLDAAPIRAIYGQNFPTLERIDLHEIVLHRDGPRVLLRFDLQEFPKHPPPKWIASGFNRVQIKLLASGVRELQIAGLQTNCIIDLSIHEEDPLIRIKADNGVVRFSLLAESLLVEKVSAYRDESCAYL